MNVDNLTPRMARVSYCGYERERALMSRIPDTTYGAPIPVPVNTERAARFNSGKPQLSLALSARYGLEGIAAVMEFGAKKYDRDNWKKGLDLESTLDSLLRHVAALLDGETNDKESGLPHIDHIATNALFAAYHHNGRKPKDEAVS